MPAHWKSDIAAGATSRDVGPQKALRSPGSRPYLLNKALHKPLRFWRTLINDHVSSSLTIDAGELGERLGGTEVYWLFLPDSDGGLTSFAMVVPEDAYYRHIQPHRPGIVRLVSRTREAYCLRDAKHDPNYDVFLDSTRSQQTAPIVWDGRVLAVHSHESPRPGAFSPISAWMLQEDAQARLTGWILGRHALSQVGQSGHAGYWNPSRHGWDPREYFQLVLQQTRQRIKEQLDTQSKGVADATVFARGSSTPPTGLLTRSPPPAIARRTAPTPAGIHARRCHQGFGLRRRRHGEGLEAYPERRGPCRAH